jgi:hypothetical protein
MSYHLFYVDKKKELNMTNQAPESKLNGKFKEWACSFSGCDAGNPKSPIWLSGIEWGFGKERTDSAEQYTLNLTNYYSKELPEEINKGFYAGLTKTYEMGGKSLTYQYGQKVAKLYTVIQGKDISQSTEIAKNSMGSEIFRLNLYPIAFPNEGDELWDNFNLANITGLQSKQIYRTWCFLHRFPWIADQVRLYKPKLLIGTGIGYLTDFIVSFGGSNLAEFIHKETIIGDPAKPETSTRTMYWTKINEHTTIVVTPFFGGIYGLNSDALLQTFGKKISEIAGFSS